MLRRPRRCSRRLPIDHHPALPYLLFFIYGRFCSSRCMTARIIITTFRASSKPLISISSSPTVIRSTCSLARRWYLLYRLYFSIKRAPQCASRLTLVRPVLLIWQNLIKRLNTGHFLTPTAYFSAQPLFNPLTSSQHPPLVTLLRDTIFFSPHRLECQFRDPGWIRLILYVPLSLAA